MSLPTDGYLDSAFKLRCFTKFTLPKIYEIELWNIAQLCSAVHVLKHAKEFPFGTIIVLEIALHLTWSD